MYFKKRTEGNLNEKKFHYPQRDLCFFWEGPLAVWTTASCPIQLPNSAQGWHPSSATVGGSALEAHSVHRCTAWPCLYFTVSYPFHDWRRVEPWEQTTEPERREMWLARDSSHFTLGDTFAYARFDCSHLWILSQNFSLCHLCTLF